CVFLATDGGVYKTLDMGETWEAKNSGLGNSKISAVMIHPQNLETLFAASQGSGVFKTSNGGERWYPINDGLGDLNVFSFVQYMQNEVQVILAGTANGLYKTENEGKNWKLIGAADHAVNGIVKTGGPSPVFYAIIDSSEVLASFDNGVNWEQLKNENQRHFVSLLPVPSTYGMVFGGTRGNGLFRFQAQGSHLKINPTALDFKELKLDSTATQFFTLTNEGSSTLRISSIISSEPAFTILKFQQNLEPAQSEKISVQFYPSVEKKYEGIISIQSNDPISPVHQVTVSGQGIYPKLITSAMKVNFGKLNVREKKKKQIQVSNGGSASLKIYDLKVNKSYFTVTSQSITLKPGENLPVDITFAPVDTGYFQDSLIIRTDIKRQAIFLDGTGTAPKFKLSDSVHAFNKIYVGDSASWKFKILNEGNAALQIKRMVNRDSLVFRVKQKVKTVSAFSSEEIIIAFFPPTPQVYQDTLFFETNDGIKNVVLSGEGVPSPLEFSAQQHDFGKLRVGNQSLPWKLTMTNPGNSPLKLTWFQGKLKNIFVYQLPDSMILAKGALIVDFKFQPDAARSYSDTIYVKTKYYETQLVLNGQGIYPKMIMSDSLLTFGDIELENSKVLTFNLQNSGDDTLHIQKMELNSTVFQVEPKTCQIAPGQKCDVKIKFSPVDTIEYQALLTIFSELREKKVQLTGSGVRYCFAASDSVHNFNKILLDTKAYWTFLLYNRGNRELKINLMKLIDGTVFSVTPSQAVVPAFDSLQAMITFQPKAAVQYVDTLKILYTNNRQMSLVLIGEGYERRKDEPFLTLSPDSVKFGKVRIGKTKAETVKLSNVGNGQLQLLKWQRQYPEFLIPSMPSILDSGESVTLNVVFQPNQRKTYRDQWSIETNINQQTIILEGTGIAPQLSASKSACEFPITMVDSTAQAELIIKNHGND
ncbi:choice-of-anchor D domain-containing protein, partial [candidate division KSB1 bacterium]|nr:choice-of-anchor D domain-containing protein [candidate division KSB1 bacterium]